MAQLARDAHIALLRHNNGFCDGQAHAGTPNKIPLIFSTIELVKNHRLLKIIDSWPTIRDTRGNGATCELRRYGDGLILRRIEIGVVNELYKCFLRAFRVGSHHREVGTDAYINLPSREGALAVH